MSKDTFPSTPGIDQSSPAPSGDLFEQPVITVNNDEAYLRKVEERLEGDPDAGYYLPIKDIAAGHRPQLPEMGQQNPLVTHEERDDRPERTSKKKEGFAARVTAAIKKIEIF